MDKPIRILIVEDREEDAELIVLTLKREGLNFIHQRVEEEKGYRQELAKPYDLILSDWSLPQFSGMRALDLMKECGKDIPFILVSGSIGEDAAIEVTRKGADDYVLKDRLIRLGQAVHRAMENKRLREAKRQADAALRESESKYRRLFESSLEGIGLSQGNRIIDANQALLDLFGYEILDEFRSIPLLDLVAPESRKMVQEIMKRTIQGQLEEVHYTYKAIRKDGKIRDVEISSEQITIGEEQYRLGTFRDITERLRLEKANTLISETERQIVSLNSIPEIIYIVATRIQELLGNSYVGATIIDDQIQAMKVIGVYGLGNMYDYFIRMFKIDPTKNMYYLKDMTDDDLSKFRSGKLELFEGGLYGLLVRKFPKRVCSAIEKELKLKSIYTMGFAWQDFHFGGITILAREDIAPYKSMIETMVNQASISIKRIRSEEALRASENKFRGVMEQSTDGTVIIDDRGVIIECNQKQEEILGYERSEMLGKFIWDIQYQAAPIEVKNSSYLERIKGFTLEMLEKKASDTFGKITETLIRRKDGTTRNIEIVIYPIRLENHFLIGSSMRDITERKRAGQALKDSEARFRIVFEHANDAIFLENEKDEVLFANQRACEMMGYTLDELMKLHVSDLQAPENRLSEKVLINEVKRHGQSAFEGVNLHSSGRRIPVEISIGRIERPEGDLYISVVRDITERKRVEAELAKQAEELRRRNDEMARLYRASSSLIGGVSFNLQEQAQRIVEVVHQEFGQDNISLFTIQHETEEVTCVFTKGPYETQVKNIRLTLQGPGLIARAIRQGQSLNIADVHLETDYITAWDAARSELAIPLKIGEEVIGLIDVQSTGVNAFTQDDERLMSTFAERAALALEHSRLNTKMETRIQQLTALRAIDMAISGSFDIHLTIGILLDQVINQLNIDAADVMAFNTAAQNLSLISERGFRTQLFQQAPRSQGSGFAWQAIHERRMISVFNLQQNPENVRRSPQLVRDTFDTYIGVPLIAKGQIRGVLEIFQRDPIKLEPEASSFLELLAGQAAIAIDNAELFENLQSSNSELSLAYDNTLEGWANALELRDHETGGHTRRATETTIRLAQAMGVKESDIVHIYRGALLHDIGKMGVPDNIIRKEGPLNDEEWVIMRKHPQYAYDLLSPISYLKLALDIPYCHHEKWDGSGYPRGLLREQIPLAARMFAVVDVWDALTSDRPYRKGWPQEKALDYIREQAGKHFDPTVVDIFLREIVHE